MEGQGRARVIYDVQHWQMGPRQADGTVGRTGELLFAGVLPDEIYFLAIGDHASFENGFVGQIMVIKPRAR